MDAVSLMITFFQAKKNSEPEQLTSIFAALIVFRNTETCSSG